jgi:hypothetical protein
MSEKGKSERVLFLLLDPYRSWFLVTNWSRTLRDEKASTGSLTFDTELPVFHMPVRGRAGVGVLVKECVRLCGGPFAVGRGRE